MGPWPAAKMAWSLIQGPDVIKPGFELVPVTGGMVVHLMLSAAFGLGFAWLASVVPTTMHLAMAFEHAFFGLVLGLGYRAWRRG